MGGQAKSNKVITANVHGAIHVYLGAIVRLAYWIRNNLGTALLKPTLLTVDCGQRSLTVDKISWSLMRMEPSAQDVSHVYSIKSASQLHIAL